MKSVKQTDEMFESDQEQTDTDICKPSPEYDGLLVNRLMIFVENYYIYTGAYQLGFNLDYQRLVSYLTTQAFEDFDLQSAHIYCVLNTQAPAKKVELLKRIYDRFSTFPKFRVHVKYSPTYTPKRDLDLCADLLLMAYRNEYDAAILCGDDEAYIPAIKAAKEMGKTIYIAGYAPDLNPQLSETADGIVSLSENVNEIQRVVVGHPVRLRLKSEINALCNAGIIERARIRSSNGGYNGGTR